MQRVSIILTAVMLSTTSGLSATETKPQSPMTVADSRYVTVEAGPVPGQMDLLNNVLEIEIPDYLNTVGQTLEYILSPYGFRLADCEPDNEAQYLLFSLPLPDPHRHLETMTLHDALSTMGGEGFAPVVNPIKRTLCYQLRSDFQHYVSQYDIEQAKHQWQVLKDTTAPVVEEEPEQQTPESYGPVKLGESLSSIASQIPVEGVTFDQLLVHLFDANQQAFKDKNMNALYAGVILIIPPLEQARAVSAAEASEIVDEHYRSWIEKR